MSKLWTLAGIVLVIVGLASLAGNDWAIGKPLTEFEKKWSFASGELRDLQLKSDDRVELKFEKSRDGTNSVDVKGQGKQPMIDDVSRTRLSDGKLELQLVEKSKNFFNWFSFASGNAKQEVVVSLADGSLLETLGVHSDSGSFAVTDAQVKTADILIDSGSVTIENLTADRLKVQANSGSIKGDRITADSEIHGESGSIRLDRVTGPTRVSANSGSVKLYKQDTTPTDIKADSGSVYVCMPASFAGFYDLQADSGSISAPESKRQTTDVVKVRADSGSIKVELN